MTCRIKSFHSSSSIDNIEQTISGLGYRFTMIRFREDFHNPLPGLSNGMIGLAIILPGYRYRISSLLGNRIGLICRSILPQICLMAGTCIQHMGQINLQAHPLTSPKSISGLGMAIKARLSGYHSRVSYLNRIGYKNATSAGITFMNDHRGGQLSGKSWNW